MHRTRLSFVLLLSAALFFSKKATACGYSFIGDCSSEIGLRINGNVSKLSIADCFYRTQVNGLHLGNMQSLSIQYGFSETWESCINNVSGMVLCYRVTAQGHDAGSWRFWPLNEDSARTDLTYTARYFSQTGDVPLTEGLELGKDYVLELYLRADIDTIGDDFIPEAAILQNNKGRNYALSFRYGGPTATPFVAVPGPATPPSCAGRSDGNVSVLVFGDQANLSYQWSMPGPPIPTRYGIGAGTHTVTISNGSGAQQIVTLTLYPPEPVVVNFPIVRPFGCGVNALAIASGTGGTGGPYTYAWSTGSTNAATAVSSAGVFSVTVSDVGGCTKTGSVPVPSGGTIKKNVSVTICPGETWQVAGQTYTQPGTYNYYLPGTACDTTVTLTLKMLWPANALASIPATEVPISNCTGPGPEVCGTAARGFSFLWRKNGQITGTETCLPGLRGSAYTVTAYLTANGKTCQAEQAVQYAQSNFTASVGGLVEPDYCNPTNPITVQLSASTTAVDPVYQWFYNGQTIASSSTIEFTVTSWQQTKPVLPVLVVQDTGSCKATATNNVNVLMPPDYNIAVAVQNASPNQNDGSVSAQVEGGKEPYKYAWNNSATTPKIEQLMPGTYCLTVTDISGCTRTQCATVSAISGLNELASKQKIRVSPNPAVPGGVLQVELPEQFLSDNMEVKILDLEGRAFVCDLEQKGPIVLLRLPASVSSGTYFLIFAKGTQTASGRFEILRH